MRNAPKTTKSVRRPGRPRKDGNQTPKGRTPKNKTGKTVLELLNENNLQLASFSEDARKRPILARQLTKEDSIYVVPIRSFTYSTGKIAEHYLMYVRRDVPYKHGPFWNRKTSHTSEFHEVCLSIHSHFDDTESVGQELRFATAQEVIDYVNNFKQFVR